MFFLLLVQLYNLVHLHILIYIYNFLVNQVLLLFLLFTWKRYRAISNLSNQVDSILHGEYDVNLIPDEEGELAVLSSELSKMTLRLRDQADRLEKDKRYLSDSLADISHQLRTPLTSIRMIVPRLATDNQESMRC